MRLATRFSALCLASSLALSATSAPAAGAPKPITAKLSAPGYTVIALAANGKAKVARVRRGRFKLRPPADSVTLHLRARGGTYAGPIVVGRRKGGRRAIVGVKAGARLGGVRVHTGYAQVSRRLRRGWVDASRWARARRGVPIGARVFGRVRSRPPRRAAPGDRDLDGIPDQLDIDDDGDLVLDKLDRSRGRRALASATRDPFDLASALAPPLERTANVNAGSSDAEIDAVLPEFGFFSMGFPSLGVPNADLVELDCGGDRQIPPRPIGLRYCSAGGTGRVEAPPGSGSLVPFPGAPGGPFDRDADGYGTVALEPGPDFQVFHIEHGATSAEIGTGDVLVLRLTDGGQETELTDMQQFIFATVPALASYVDETGRQTKVSYPVAADGPGTAGNGFPVVDGPDAGSDIEVVVTLWRPQRRPISEAECVQPPQAMCTETEWIDVGGLDYTASSRDGQRSTNDSGWCAPSHFAENDPNLSPGFPDPQGGGFKDSAADRPANPANTYTYTLNLTRCLNRYGFSFNPGQTRQFGFEAFTPITGDGSAGIDNATTFAHFTAR
jgi:hypothetical protein